MFCFLSSQQTVGGLLPYCWGVDAHLSPRQIQTGFKPVCAVVLKTPVVRFKSPFWERLEQMKWAWLELLFTVHSQEKTLNKRSFGGGEMSRLQILSDLVDIASSIELSFGKFIRGSICAENMFLGSASLSLVHKCSINLFLVCVY